MEKYYLTEEEREKVVQFNADEKMRNAVQKVLLERIYHSGVLEKGEPVNNRNWAFNLGGLNDMAMKDEELGNLLKVTVKGMGLVEAAFEDIKQFTNTPKDEPEEPQHV